MPVQDPDFGARWNVMQVSQTVMEIQATPVLLNGDDRCHTWGTAFALLFAVRASVAITLLIFFGFTSSML
jgi:hypothetical protein